MGFVVVILVCIFLSISLLWFGLVWFGFGLAFLLDVWLVGFLSSSFPVDSFVCMLVRKCRCIYMSKFLFSQIKQLRTR